MEGYHIHDHLGPVRNVVRSIVMKDLEDDVSKSGGRGFFEYGRKYLEALNIHVDRISSSNPEFLNWKNALETKKGILISNHPSIADAAILFSLLKGREDVRIVVNSKLYRQSEGSPIQKYFISANHKTFGRTKDALKEMKEHISSGGILLMFPTGGVTNEEINNFNFHPGFRSIISSLDPEDMVYVLDINKEQAQQLAGSLGVASALFAEEYLGKDGNMRRFGEERQLKVAEKYTKAEEWKRVIDNEKTKHNMDTKLASHYLNIFDKKD